MTYPAYTDEVVEAAERHDLDPALVAGVIDRETGGHWHAWTSRFERDWRYLVHPETFAPIRGRRDDPIGRPQGWPAWVADLKISGTTELVAQMHSWGLMHVMGSVAREHGYRWNLIGLAADPATGLLYGCKHLVSLLRRHGSERAALEAYNDGRADGRGAGVEYADDVLRRRERFT